MKRVSKKVINFVKANKNKLAIIGAVASASLLPEMGFAADDSGDLLSSQQTTVNNTFGHGSTLEKWFYFAEIIISLFTYFKVRTPMVFMGLIMVIIFTRIGFGIAG
jgi:type IV conjugative transfer system pilin TraA